MRIAATGDTWDGVWADYDRKAGVEAVTSAVIPVRPHNRRLRFALTLSPLVALFPTETMSLPGPAPWQAAIAGPVLSLARDEATMPPLTVAIARLAAESASGACFAMRLHPQGDGCHLAR